MPQLTYNLKRAFGYLLGFILFYEPFMLFGQLTANFFTETGFASIHIPCARIPLANIITGQWQDAGPTSFFFCLLLAVSSLSFGPLFCGRLCPAGAFSELLSHLLPDKYKIDWPKLVPILPLRYGFFAGFLLSVWLELGVPCTYCNYYSFEIFINWLLTGGLLNNLWSLAATFFLANIFLGMFTKGGRGYCQLLCPVGTYNAILHILGRQLPFTIKMQVKQKQCVGCGKCNSICPMRAIALKERKAQITASLCIVCGQCAHACPQKAICYSSSLHKEDKYE